MYYDKIMCSKPFAEIQTQQFQSAVSDIEGNQSNCTVSLSTRKYHTVHVTMAQYILRTLTLTKKPNTNQLTPCLQMTISTKGANKCWWYVYLCQDSCTRVEFRGNATKEWRTNVVTLPVHKGR